jgi:putative endonuclease
MFYVYVLISTKDGDTYIGSTKDLKKRLAEHRAGYVDSTRNRRPLKLAYYEAYAAEDDARAREKNLKLRGQARTGLIKRIRTSLLRSR